VLGETGHSYSSSIVPIRHDLYGMPGAPRFAFQPAGSDLVEFPVTTVRIAGRNLPCGGGGWFRLVPYPGMRWALRRVNTQDRQPAIFYFHPWEIDPAQPRQTGLDHKTRFRHYLNLDRTEARLERLLADFAWGRMDQVLLNPSRAATSLPRLQTA
jgi:polysaccharide deacetylase family protein (PEP-CTERM system associated)